MSQTLLDANQLAKRIQYSPVYINRMLRDSVFLEGIHYIRPFGGGKFYTSGRRSKQSYLSPETALVM